VHNNMECAYSPLWGSAGRALMINVVMLIRQTKARCGLVSVSCVCGCRSGKRNWGEKNWSQSVVYRRFRASNRTIRGPSAVYIANHADITTQFIPIASPAGGTSPAPADIWRARGARGRKYNFGFASSGRKVSADAIFVRFGVHLASRRERGATPGESGM
jgi:hypothetical protein